MRNKVRVGIIGLGYMGSIHLNKLINNKNVIVTAVYDTDFSKYNGVKNRAVYMSKTAEEIVHLVDAVIIASPSVTHYEYLKYFLGNGIHCLCEKPPVIKLKQLFEMIRLSKDKRLVFNVVMPERENPVVKYIMKKVFNKGYVFISDRVAPFAGRSADISVLYDIMIHDLDLLRKIIPFDIKRISASGLKTFTGNTDILNVRIEYENGSFAILNASRLAMEKKRTLRIFYKGGYFSTDLINKVYKNILVRKGAITPKTGVFDNKEYDPILIIDRDFINSIKGLQKRRIFSAESLIETVNLCNMIERKIIEIKVI